jgi:hypothetical protein
MTNKLKLSMRAAFLTLVVVLVVIADVGVCHVAARVPPAGGRSLQQLATGSCPNRIAGCEGGRCGTKTVNGALASVCERCRLPYVRANNGVQCGELLWSEIQCTRYIFLLCVTCRRGQIYRHIPPYIYVYLSYVCFQNVLARLDKQPQLLVR